MGALANEASNVEEQSNTENNISRAERAQWVLNAPHPPTLWCEFVGFIKDAVSIDHGNNFSSSSTHKHIWRFVILVLRALFPILDLGQNYNLSKFKSDLMAGLTLASLSIPQSIGYANLAKVDPQYGLYTSVVPPMIYALMGSSREIAIGPVAVVSLLLSSMIQKLVDPVSDPIGYRKLLFTATFFAGTFQAVFGFFRLGFLVDFLSHAAIVGFMGGAAIVISLQQTKGLLGISHFTDKTDVISVLDTVWRSFHHPWNPLNFLIGCSFLIFILMVRFLGRRNRKFFWLPAIAPLISVILSTLIVFLTRADKHGVKILKHIKRGLNPTSAGQIQLNGPLVGEAAKIGLISAIIALTESMAVGRSFASLRGYHLDGNKEMVAMGMMNVAGSLTSCYVATGSFSRTAVNFSAGCQTVVSNVVMAVTVLISLELFTRLLYFTPTAILASVILSALPGLIDVREAYHIWKVDKLDFLACIGAFLGVLFASVEIGLLTAVTISFGKILLNAIRPHIEVLGRLPGSDTFRSITQYPIAVKTPGVLSVRIHSNFLCFVNSNFVRERYLFAAVERERRQRENMKRSLTLVCLRIMRWVADEEQQGTETKGGIQVVILDLSDVMNIDTSGIQALEELHKKLVSQGTELALANPCWQVIHKLKLAQFVEKIGGRVFLTMGEAVDGTSCGSMMVDL